ncbi:HAD-IC family P-type ATPase [Lysinimonas soli]|uniref:HAD-IC family P-type ATPase n=1 Tax=Lysinimonas soli TaxID=1074233 RepID=A0ABW0NQ49_9MICO
MAGPVRGLSSAEVEERVRAGLSNRYRAVTSRPVWQIVRENVLTLFNLVVGLSFGALLVLGDVVDALFGFFAIANTAIGVAQETRAKITLDRLALLEAPQARVLRDGVPTLVARDAVVRDDVLVLTAGDQLVADAVVLSADGLELDESMLTGEADPIPAEAARELLAGSFVVAGTGLARATRVGASSYANRITAGARGTGRATSEIRAALRRVIRWVSWILLPIAALVLNGQMDALGGWSTALANGSWREGAIRAISSVIGMVPQGLVFITSVALAVAAVALLRSRVLVQDLPAVETLARVDVLCFDKTGTLTDGTMVLDGCELLDERPGWDAVLGWFGTRPDANVTARSLVERFGAVGAAVGAAAGADSRPEAADPAPTAVGFDSARKWSAVGFAAGPARGSWVLGAPDVVLAEGRGGVAASAVLTRAGELAASGLRVLVLAASAVPLRASGERDVAARAAADTAWLRSAPLEPVALITVRERLRPDAAATVAFFREQGVELRILSGDHPSTVAAVARAAGIPVTEAIDARTLPTDPAGLAAALDRHPIIGRVTPEQKRDMVLAMRSAGHIVAMIGDGANDALALSHADLGIAMGSGVAATRAVSQLVLLDGDFDRLPQTVAYGRRVISNVERLAKLFLAKTVYAIVLAIVFGALLWTFPLLPRQFAATDGLTIGLPALVLAGLAATDRAQAGFLRRALRFCVPSGLVIALVVTGLVVALRAMQADATATSTAVVLALTVVGLWLLGILLRPLDLRRVLLLLALALGLAGTVLIPWVSDFFSLGPPAPVLPAAAVAAALGILALEVLRRSGVTTARRRLRP